MDKIFKTTLLATILVMSLASCNDWLDVAPKSQLAEKDLFSRESGYKDQLTGVYTTMCSTSMYGLQESVGFAEVLSQNYSINPSSATWRYVKDYDYKNANVEDILNNIWLNNYNCIANLNILLKNINENGSKVIINGNDSIYKGEAIGLRAYLHLELMRYFACAPSMSTTTNGVPYVTEYGTHVTPQKSVGETMQLIINDLLQAREFLTASLRKATSQTDTRIFNRSAFNYYACVATLARAYLWNGDKTNALKYAEEIIHVNDHADGTTSYGPFYWVYSSTFQTSNKADWRPSFPSEMIFQLNISDWEKNGNTYLHADKGVDALTPNYDYAQEVYELNAGLGADYRLAYGFEQDGQDKYLSRLWYVEGRTGGNNLIPLIRMSECYYIAAECLAETDPAQAVKYLNIVRYNRGLSSTPLSTELTSDEVRNEIYKEYRKEFLGEGQLFFYYKRLNVSTIPGSALKGSQTVYVMPIPSNDQEFGGYSN